MANELFKRIALLKIGPSAKGVSTSLDSLSPKLYKGYRIAFNIGKSSESKPNCSKIEIYNLSPKSRSELESVGLSAALEVGYEGLDGQPLMAQIFIGDIKRVKSERKGPDVVTTLEAGDAEVAITETTIEASFAPNTTTTTVIGSLAKKLDVAVGTIMPGLAGLFENGLSLSGLVSDHLDTLTKKTGLEWNVTDGELNILEPSVPTPETAVLVSADSGLIGIPSKRETGVEFESLINPLIKPGRAISLVSNAISGVFKAVKCHYEGDTHEGKWSVTVEAI